METERSEHHPLDERPQPRVIGEGGDRGCQGLLSLCTTGETGTRATEVGRCRRADTDEQDPREARVGQPLLGEHDVLDDLTGLAGCAAKLEQAEDVEVDLVEKLRGTGAEGDPALVAKHRDRDDVGADDSAWRHIAECDLWW